MESASAISCFNSVRLRVQLGKELASLLLSGRADTRFLIQQRMPSWPGKFQLAVPKWRPLRNDLFFGKFRRSRGSFLSRNEKRLRSQSPWYPWPPIAPVKRSFQLRVGGCGSHSCESRHECGHGAVRSYRALRRELTCDAKSVHRRTEPALTGNCRRGRAREPGGEYSPRSVFAKACLGPTERQSRNGRIISQ